MSDGEYVLFYDGSCGLCRRSAALVAWLKPRRPLRLVDASQPQNLAPFPQLSVLQALQSVHLLTPAGQLYRGYDAVVELTRLLPLLRWLAPLMALSFSRRIGSATYEWVTAHATELAVSFIWNKYNNPFKETPIPN